MVKFLKRWGPVLLWCGLIFAGSSLPSAQVSQNRLVDFFAHKVIHLFEYGVLAALVFCASGSVLLSLIFAIFYGAFDEWHQTFVCGREGRLRDLLVDVIGASLGLLAICQRKKRKKVEQG